MDNRFSSGTPQQRAAMQQFRAYNERLYAKSKKFAELVADCRSQIGRHWPKEQAARFVDELLRQSWGFISPANYLSEWTEKAVEAIGGGTDYEQLEAGGFFSSEIALHPVWNVTEQERRLHELAEFDYQQQLPDRPAFSQQIAQLIKNGNTPPRSNN